MMTEEQLEQFIAQYKRDELDAPQPPVPVSKAEELELESILGALGDE